MNNKLFFLISLFLIAPIHAEVEVSGKLTHETSLYTGDGRTIGATSDVELGDFLKSETNARVYFDGSLGESGDSFHVELQGYKNINDSNTMSNNQSYTQRELLREAYIDTQLNDWALRAGKQQVVWGKADGMKLLDIINPTDFSEMAQNQMEDSRIPVLMLNAEKIMDDGSSFQIVTSQPRENIFSGLDRSISQGKRTNASIYDAYTNVGTGESSPTNPYNDSFAATMFSSYAGDTANVGHNTGNPFILKGVDTITGKNNGFLNIVPDLGSVAALFGRAFSPQGTVQEDGLNPGKWSGAHSGFTVGGFNTAVSLANFSTTFDAQNGSGASNGGFETTNLGLTPFWRDDDGDFSDGLENWGSSAASNTTAGDGWTGKATLAGFAGLFGSGTALNNTSTTAVDSVFEYMDRTSFATFDAFVNASSEYVYDMPDDTDLNLAVRFNDTTKDGLNYSFAYSYNYDQNPVLDLTWRDKNGNQLYSVLSGKFYTQDTDSVGDAGYGTPDAIYSKYLTLSSSATGGGTDVVGGYAAEAANSVSGAGTGTEYATLRMTETLKRAHNLGAAFDYALDTEGLGPVVIRAEGLYQKDVYSPIVDRGALSIGDLTKALVMKPGDKFKYVIGADITVLKDMMVSGQFIQERNLDYVDSDIDYVTGEKCNDNDTNNIENCGSYTADFAAMHLTNGMKKAEKNKNFYSLFMSKPYGASGQHRWNNILMLEENGGRWNRFDTEYTIDDNTQFTAEFNKYWGNEDTQFGQLGNSSNVQVGVKVLF